MVPSVAEKLAELGCLSFAGAPLPNQPKIDRMCARDLNGESEGLSVVPVVERCEAISTRIRGRQCQRCDVPQRQFGRDDSEVVSDRERPGRELDGEGNLGVNELGTLANESKFAKRFVEAALGDTPLEDEVRVLRDVVTRVDGHARAAGHYCPDATAGQMGADRDGYFLQCGGGGEFHRRFPARLGRRLSSAVRVWSSASAAASRRRKASSSVRAKNRGLKL